MTKHQANVHWSGDIRDGSGKAVAKSGAFQVTTRLKARAEGPIQGETTPEELIAAAHASCLAMSIEATLAKERFAVEGLDVEAVVGLDRSANGFKITESVLKVRAKNPQKGLEIAKFREIVQRAEQTCPVSLALRNNVKVTVETELG
jgi:osmotically inducible protein OsmC